jgi:hypothetical protein
LRFAVSCGCVVGCLPSVGKVDLAGGISLMQTSKYTELPQAAPHPTLQQLVQEHSLYERRLNTLRSKLYLTEPEKIEEVRLKKLKLSIKDEMERLRRMEASQMEH